MWGEVGVAEEDMLDAEAAKRVIRRAFRMLAPYRRRLLGATALLVIWVCTAVSGPLPPSW